MPTKPRVLTAKQVAVLKQGQSPERVAAFRAWVLQNRPWKLVKVRQSLEWRAHLASIRPRVDGIGSLEFKDEKRLLREAVALCQAVIVSAYQNTEIKGKTRSPSFTVTT